MEFHKRKAAFEYLKKFNPSAKESDFIEVTEWFNGEGVDIVLSDSKFISITYEELEAIKYLVEGLTYDFKKGE